MPIISVPPIPLSLLQARLSPLRRGCALSDSVVCKTDFPCSNFVGNVTGHRDRQVFGYMQYGMRF